MYAARGDRARCQFCMIAKTDGFRERVVVVEGAGHEEQVNAPSAGEKIVACLPEGSVRPHTEHEASRGEKPRIISNCSSYQSIH